MIIKKSTLYMLGVLLLIVIAGYFVMSKTGTTGNAINDNSDVQKIVLSVKNGNYYPNTITVKSGTPVRIYLDSSVTGCLRSFTIKDFGVAKNLPTPQDYVEFTPNKVGTYKFACSMGMGTGTLIVK